MEVKFDSFRRCTFTLVSLLHMLNISVTKNRRSCGQMSFKQWKSRIMKQKAMAPQHFLYLELVMNGQRNCIVLIQVFHRCSDTTNWSYSCKL